MQKESQANDDAADVDSSLEELAHQKSTVMDLINKSYQSYKPILEKCCDNALEQLIELYHER